jgi:tetratricopeptide (TPR) repeat protein
MTTRTTILVLALAMTGGPLAAQEGGISLRLAQGQMPKYTPPLCPLKPMNGKVDKASQLLRKAYDAKTPVERATALGEARSNLASAFAEDAQTGNPAAWYFLARIALMRGDAAEADSGFTKVEAMVPACEIDITQYRQNSWAMLGKAGIEFQQKGEIDSAMAQFRDAATLFRGLPHIYSNMGVLFANRAENDSAAVYFAKSLAIAETDTSLVEDRNSAAMNLAVMYQRINRHLDALKMLQKYLVWRPDDKDARKALAASYRGAGFADSADAVDGAMVAEFSKANLDSLEMQDLMAVGVAAFNAKRYPEAENAFGHAVKRNPYSRDARYNLANSYFALKNNEQLVEHAGKLLELEPFNEDALKLLAQGQRGLKLDAEVIKTATRLVGMLFSVDVTGFQMGQSSAKLQGEAIGRAATDSTGKSIKAAPVTMVIDFLNTTGAVVDTKEFAVPAMAEGQRHPISIEAKGAGITGWKYRIK